MLVLTMLNIFKFSLDNGSISIITVNEDGFKYIKNELYWDIIYNKLLSKDLRSLLNLRIYIPNTSSAGV